MTGTATSAAQGCGLSGAERAGMPSYDGRGSRFGKTKRPGVGGRGRVPG